MTLRTGFFAGGGVVAALIAAAGFFVFIGHVNASAIAPMHLMDDGHYTTPVTINGRGPFNFVVDTGAQGSVIAPELSRQLGLVQIGGAHVAATSGKGAGSITILKNYSSALFSRTGAMMVVLPPGSVVKEGVLGMNLFTSRRLELSFAEGSVSSADSGPTPAGFVAVPVNIVQNSFIVTDVVIDGVKVKAMIDTGARRTIGNLLLQTALGFGNNDPRLSVAQPVGGATIDTTKAMKAQLGSLTLGGQRFEHPVLTFSDVPVLGPLGLTDGPAMVIGLDLLKSLKAVAIDYPRAELQLKP